MADFTGTWKAFAGKAKAAPPATATPKRPKPRPKRPADALHLLGSLDPKPEGYVVLGAPPLPERPAVVEAGYVDGVRTGGKVTLPASAPASLHPAGGRVHAIGMKRGVRGPEAVIAWLAKRSVVVELVDGKLVAYASRGQMVDTTRELLTKATPLLTAHLSGEPLRCAWPHKEKTPPAAVSVVEPGLAPICEAHLLEDRP
jgi:hypothetical protein